MLGSELVQDVGGIKASVVAELAGNDLEGFSVSTYQQLLLAWNGPGIVPQVFGKLHLYRTTAGNNRVVLKKKRGDSHSHSRKGKSRKASFPAHVACQGDGDTPGPGESIAQAAVIPRSSCQLCWELQKQAKNLQWQLPAAHKIKGVAWGCCTRGGMADHSPLLLGKFPSLL